MTKSLHVTVPDAEGREVFTVGAGPVGDFAFGFVFYDTAQIKATVDGVEVSLASVVGNGSTRGGWVGGLATLVTPVSNATVVIYEDRRYERLSDFNETGRLPIAALNSDLDYQVGLSQQLRAALNRCLRLPIGDPRSGTGMELPDASSQNDVFLKLDENGALAFASVPELPLSSSDIGGLLYPANPSVEALLTVYALQYPIGHLLRYIPTGEHEAILERTSTYDVSGIVEYASSVMPLYVPRGTYRISQNITLAKPVSFDDGAVFERFAGAVISLTGEHPAYSLESAGADPTGVAESTVAIQDACNTGGKIDVGENATYKMGKVEVFGGTTFTGSCVFDSTDVFAATDPLYSDTMFYRFGNGVSADGCVDVADMEEGIKFYGKGSGIEFRGGGVGLNYDAGAALRYSQALWFVHIKDLWFENCVFRGQYGRSCILTRCVDFRFKNCTVIDSGSMHEATDGAGDGLAWQGCINGGVEDSYIANVGNHAVNGWRSRGNVVRGNTIKNCGYSAVTCSATAPRPQLLWRIKSIEYLGLVPRTTDYGNRAVESFHMARATLLTTADPEHTDGGDPDFGRGRDEHFYLTGTIVRIEGAANDVYNAVEGAEVTRVSATQFDYVLAEDPGDPVGGGEPDSDAEVENQNGQYGDYSHNNIRNVWNGVLVENEAHHSTIIGNNIYDSNFQGILLGGGQSDGPKYCVVAKNIINRVKGRGIDVYGSGGSVVDGNAISNTGQAGILVLQSASNEVESPPAIDGPLTKITGNVIESCGTLAPTVDLYNAGILLDAQSNVTVQNNSINNSGSQGAPAIEVRNGSVRNKIRFNDITNCEHTSAIAVGGDCDENELSGNEIDGGSVVANGIQLTSGGVGNHGWHNKIFDITSVTVNYGGASLNNWIYDTHTLAVSSNVLAAGGSTWSYHVAPFYDLTVNAAVAFDPSANQPIGARVTFRSKSGSSDSVTLDSGGLAKVLAPGAVATLLKTSTGWIEA